MTRMRRLCVVAATLMASGSALLAAPATDPSPALSDAKPLFRDFLGVNGHFTFKPELYRPAVRLVRNYHNVNWDVKQPGDPITLPVCVNRVNWKNDVYGPWRKTGYETDICLQLSGFQTDVADYQRFWIGQERWCYDYGKAMAAAFGPSGQERLCTSIEIGNEPGAKFDLALFRTLFQQMARGIREGDPRIKILTPAVHARPGDDYSQDLRGLYAQKEIVPLYDVINLHTYASVERKDPSESPWTRSYPEDPSIAYLDVVNEAIAWRDRNAPGKEIWVTEFGYDACTPEAMNRRQDWFQKLDWQGHTDLQQAQYLVRSFFAFAERDVQRAYIYYYDDDDSPSVHGCSGLTRRFVPKPSLWAVRQLAAMLGDYRFQRVVEKRPGDLCVQEYQHGDDPNRVIWVAWSPTGTRTNAKDRHVPRETTVTLTGLPSLPLQAVGMATAAGEAQPRSWEKAGPAAITLTVGESPAYLSMTKRDAGRSDANPDQEAKPRSHRGDEVADLVGRNVSSLTPGATKEQPAQRSAAPPGAPRPRDYRFDRTISREVLENYLDRSITMEGLLNGRGDLEDNIRMLKSTGAKFIGRSLCLWGGEANLLPNLERARQQLPRVHVADPDMILQACIFEIVTTQVEQVPIPDWAFTALGLPAEKRNFRYAAMLYPNGRFKDHWRAGNSVPDASRPETKLWFYFLGASFIDLGIEAIHFGQTELMNHNDRQLDHYSQVLALLRDYAARHARRHLVLCDSHVPSGGLVRNGQLLMDFHSFPLRIMEVPDKPQQAVLKVGFSDGIYGRSKGGRTSSGWTCEHLPYLVEIDNWGVSDRPGQPNADGIWIWGYDEITWFAQQPPEYRSHWLRYAWDWVRQTDPNGHLQMPGSRTLRSPLDNKRWYYANARSSAVPEGFGDEEAIRAIWATDGSRR